MINHFRLLLTVTIVINALIRHFIRNQRFHQLIVCIQQTANPLLALHQLDIPQDLPAQRLARLEPLDAFGVFADARGLAVQVAHAVEQVCGGDGGVGDGGEHGGFLALEGEGFLTALVGRGGRGVLVLRFARVVAPDAAAGGVVGVGC